MPEVLCMEFSACSAFLLAGGGEDSESGVAILAVLESTSGKLVCEKPVEGAKEMSTIYAIQR